jgi:hypothetical protein
MSEIKTTATDDSVDDFINAVPDENKRREAFILLKLFEEITGEQPKMWSSGIIGFGQYHYKSERSKQEGDWMLTGFSPRKQALTLYLMHGFDRHSDLLQKLGKHKTSMGCLYINKLGDVDLGVLRELIQRSFDDVKAQNS